MTSTPVGHHTKVGHNPNRGAGHHESCFVPPRQDLSKAEEQANTREVILLIAELDALTVQDGRIVVPADASEELAARIRRVESELFSTRGYESGPRFGYSWMPARLPEPPWRVEQA